VKRPHVWPDAIMCLFLLQKIAAVFHYFFYKRTILILSDSKFHRDSEWLHEKIRLREIGAVNREKIVS